MSPALTITLACLPLLAFLLVGLRRVPEGTAYTVHRFGHYARTLSPGLRFVTPLIERVSSPITLINHRVQLSLEANNAASPRAAFYYQILEPARSGDQLDAIDQLVEREVSQLLEAVLAAAGRDVEALNGRVKQALNERLGTLGLRVTRCQLGV